MRGAISIALLVSVSFAACSSRPEPESTAPVALPAPSAESTDSNHPIQYIVLQEPGDPPRCVFSLANPVAGIERFPSTGNLALLGGYEIVDAAGLIGGLSAVVDVYDLWTRYGLDHSVLIHSVRLDAVSDTGKSTTLLVERRYRTGATVPLSLTAYWCDPRHFQPAPSTSENSKVDFDAEGVALIGEDNVAISFEQRHQIDLYALDSIRTGSLYRFRSPGPALGDISSLEPNQGLEALALLQNGTLIAGAESPTVLGRAHPVWRFAPTGDEDHPFADAAGPSFKIASEPGYGLVGFDVTPAGHLLVLQRFYAPRLGYKTKIGWIPKAEIELAEGTLRPRTLARLDRSSPVPVDNFEGVAASAGPDGETLIWIVSDDNFNPDQKTLLYVFAFDETAFAAKDSATH